MVEGKFRACASATASDITRSTSVTVSDSGAGSAYCLAALDVGVGEGASALLPPPLAPLLLSPRAVERQQSASDEVYAGVYGPWRITQGDELEVAWCVFFCNGCALRGLRAFVLFCEGVCSACFPTSTPPPP